MSNATVEGFYTKNPGESYRELYDLDHGPRLDALIARYDLKTQLAGKRVVDVGGGLGFLGKRLDASTDYWVIDGAEVKPEERLCTGKWIQRDLDYHELGVGIYDLLKNPTWPAAPLVPPPADAAFCLETLEHVGNPHHVLVEIKKLVKPNGDVYLSIPTESVTHNTPYPSLLWPPQNFELFLRQMALPILDFYVYQPVGRGWPAYQWRCRNAAWSEKALVFPKSEEKFRDCTPLEATNL